MLRTVEAMRLGVHPRVLYALRNRGDLEQVGRGLYRLSTAEPLTNPDLVRIAIRSPRAAICLSSALAYHDLTTQVPHTVDVALPSHAPVPKVHVPVRVYSAEKTIADCFKYRNKIGPAPDGSVTVPDTVPRLV